MAEDRYLPGIPKKKLVREVKRHLAFYGIRPTQDRIWRDAWEWAKKVTYSYVFPRWPLPSEIAAQYVLLLMADMGSNRHLKLPFRANEQQPDCVKFRLSLSSNKPNQHLPQITDESSTFL